MLDTSVSPPERLLPRVKTAPAGDKAAGSDLPAGEALTLDKEQDEPATQASGRGQMPVKVGRFRVVRKLGEGGMGVVYEAYDGELDRKVAIKLLSTRALIGSQGRPRLLREAKAMARLSHPNVVTVYDVGEFRSQVFIAMEFVEGMTFKEWLGEPRPWRRILQAFVEAGEGLAAAHAAGVVHRDFKPENVLVGNDGRVRVLDFGLARPIGEEERGQPQVPTESVASDQRLTVTGAVMGTPAYMAPEQFLGTPTDHRTDQFAFCIALWEALYGARPFAAGSYHELAMDVAEGKVEAPPTGHPIPAWVEQVLRKGLAPDADDRYDDMRAVLSVLERLRQLPGEAPAGGDERTVDVGEVARMIGRLYRVVGPLQADGQTGYRAVDRLSGRTVAVQLVSADVMGSIRTASRVQLIQRLQKLSNLHHPNVVDVLDYGFLDGQPYFVTPLHENAVGVLDAARGQPLSIQLSLVAQMLQGVAYLHRRGVHDLGLRADNVRVVDGKVKIFDLGASVLRAYQPAADAETAAYSAPEALLGRTVSAPGDLYAAGVIAHEVLTGRRPVDAADTSTLIDRKLAEEPELADPEIDPKVLAVLSRVLRRDPDARPANAGEVIRELGEAAGVRLSRETLETRESFLRAARFVGRDAELAQLDEALRGALDRKGTVWLVGGESGVGKSRLLDELRMVALADEAFVLRGQARSESARPYELWRGVMRWLVMMTTLDAVDAAVLAPLVPEAPDLLDKSIHPAPPLDARNSQARLTVVVESALGRLERPLLVLLDDLQWARSESVDLLARLAESTAELPVLIVASYRDDEDPHLPARVPAAKSMSLRRLGGDAIAELSRSMVGDAGGQPALLELLERETEGNAFFLVEVMRALAEEAGELEGVGEMDLPTSVVAGGVRKVIRRRLDRVEEWARPILDVAAVAGRAVDLEILKRTCPDVDLERWVYHCADAAVLETTGAAPRFAHDKLRELLLEGMGDSRRTEIHTAIAEAVEAGSAGDPTLSHVLAFHFGRADQPRKEGHYAAVAGEYAFRAGSYRESVALLDRAFELRGRCEFPQGDLVRWRRMKGEAHYVLGDLSRAVDELAETLREAGQALPNTRLGWTLLLLRLVAVQVLYLALPGRFRARDESTRLMFGEAASAAGRIANLSTYSGDTLRVFAGSLLAANLGERSGTTNPYSLAIMGYSAVYMGMRTLAERYFERARVAAATQRDAQGLVEASQMEAVYLQGQGQFDRCDEILGDARDAAQSSRHRLGLALCEGFWAQMELFRGDFASMRDRYAKALDMLGFPSPEHEHSFLCGQAQALVLLGDFDGARSILEDRANKVGAQYLLGDLFVGSPLAMASAWGGDIERAVELANRLIDTIHEKKIAVPPATPQVYAGPAEAYIAARKAGNASAEVVTRSEKLAKEVEAWARRFPVGQAQALVFRGHLHALDGRAERAREAWEGAIEWSSRLELPFWQASAELALGEQRLGQDAEKARSSLLRAHALFGQCGAAYHAELARRQLGWDDGDGDGDGPGGSTPEDQSVPPAGLVETSLM